MRRLAWLPALLLLVAACGSDSEDPLPTLTLPPIDPRLEAHGQGRVALDVPAGGSQAIDPLVLATDQGIDPPACAGFVFLFGWQVQRGQELSFTGTRQSATFAIIDGQNGNASTGGCILLEAHNEGDEPVTGELRYILAETGG